jgi:hypothetical protein
VKKGWHYAKLWLKCENKTRRKAMSDSRRRNNAIAESIKQLHPGGRGKGHVAAHLHTLSLIISGIVGSAHSQLAEIATKAPGDDKLESRIKKIKRWLTNPDLTEELYWLPFAQALIQKLSRAKNELKLVIDGSNVGEGCAALVVGVVYGGRALPVSWLVVKGTKGHFSQAQHLTLLEKVKPLVPKGVKVTFLGDGEFDGTLLQEAVASEEGWQYVVRTAKNTLLRVGTTWRRYSDFDLKPGEVKSLSGVGFSSEGYGKLLAIGYWDERYDEPLYLISNLDCPYEALDYYKSRFRIETFFSDQKSRGFRLDKSQLSHPERLSRLMIGCALAYWWLLYLGLVAREGGDDKQIHRTERCDLSFFQLGWRYLDYLLEQGRRLPTKLLALPAWANF